MLNQSNATSINGCIQHCEMECDDFKIIKTDTIINGTPKIKENVIENDDDKNENENEKEQEISTTTNEFKIMFKLAIPVCVTSISRIVMWNTDEVFLGHLGTKQLAGIIQIN